MRKNYFTPGDLTGYSLQPYNNDTRIMCFKGTAIVTDYSSLPGRLIEQAARFLGLSLRGETSMYTGRVTYKIAVICNDKGGIVGLHSTESKADRNRYVLNYCKPSEPLSKKGSSADETITGYKHGDDLFLVFPDRVANAGYIEIWAQFEGHSEAVLEYVQEAEQVNAPELIELYIKLYGGVA